MTPPALLHTPPTVSPHEEWRYEVKLVAPGFALPLARSWVRAHRGAFSASYPPRVVNNLYLDSHDMQLLYDGVEGFSERRKVRLRWYGEEGGLVRAVFEVKRKRDRANWKLQYALQEPLELDAGATWPAIMSRALALLPGRMRMEIGTGLVPVLVNRYRREYYEERAGKLRITVDSAQDVYDQRLSARPNFTRPAPQHDSTVIEVKGPLDAWERIKEIASDFPVSVARNSKYALGYESIVGL